MGEQSNEPEKSTSGKRVKMKRSKALLTMGAMAAGLPVVRQVLTGLIPSETITSQATIKIPDDPVLLKAIRELEYLTPADKFVVQRRGQPVLSEIPADKLQSIGLTRETWKLEIVPDPESNSEIDNPLTIEKGNAIGWSDLMKLAEKRAVRYLHLLTCTNVRKPYGMGLWEGVPLREVIWMAEPKQNIRRIFFWGYHNDDPKQIFQGSLHISRALEEAPGELPVILCFKLNGKWLSQANGGPVRLIVPGYYGNRSIKWLQKILITNKYQANDTYADGNNDVESPIKTCSRFIHAPDKVKPGQKFAFTGLAQVGASGLRKVQYWIHPAGLELPESDPYMDKGAWRDAYILQPPEKWGSDLPGGKLPPILQIDEQTGKPLTWPLPNTIVHWAALEKINESGVYDLRCRTIDGNGIAQPLPRPFGRSGTNAIEVSRLLVET